MLGKGRRSRRGIKTILRKFFLKIKLMINTIRVAGKPKIFVIGLNKTGTSTMAKALRDLGFLVANEREAKPLFHAWVQRDFKPIVEFCKSAQAFQDSPFSFPDTFISLDKAYPGSKFILTIRDDEHQWYRSIVRFHSKLWGSGDGNPPTKEQLKEAVNSYRGRPWDVNRALFKSPENDPYNEDILKRFYVEYNKSVVDYFIGRSEDFLVINVANGGDYKKLVDFLGAESMINDFPWENRT